MSISQKTAWIQMAIFGALFIGWVALFAVNGTIFYWQNNTMKMTFYWLTAAAFAGLVIMNIVMSVIQKTQKEITDERDRSIFRRASLWATGTSYTVVVILLLVLSITYMNRGSNTLPVNFPLFIVIIGGAMLVLTQAITALILYNRKFKHE